MRYDVVIVGAGPSGAVLAYLLAEAGAEVLLLEKKVFPRYKACGGGLAKRALDSIPFEVDEVMEERVHTMKAFIENYTRVLGEDIAKDLACARTFAGILYGFSNLSSRIIKAHGSRLAKLHMEVVTGRMTYRELYRKLLHLNRVVRILLALSK